VSASHLFLCPSALPIAIHGRPGYPCDLRVTYTPDLSPSLPITYPLCCHVFFADMSDVATATACFDKLPFPTLTSVPPSSLYLVHTSPLRHSHAFLILCIRYDPLRLSTPRFHLGIVFSRFLIVICFRSAVPLSDCIATRRKMFFSATRALA